jgi:hypothetical protein
MSGPTGKGQAQVFKELFGDRVNLNVFTTKPTTALREGDLMLIFHGDVPKLGVCISNASQTIKLVSLKTSSMGRLTY